MSDSLDKSVVITLKISKKLHEKLMFQLRLMKEHHIEGFENAENIEDLILFYLEYFSLGEEKIKTMESKMHKILHTLRDGEVDILEILNSLSRHMKEEDKSKEKTSKNEDISSTKKKS